VTLVSLVDLVLKGRDDEDGDDKGEGAADAAQKRCQPRNLGNVAQQLSQSAYFWRLASFFHCWRFSRK